MKPPYNSKYIFLTSGSDEEILNTLNRAAADIPSVTREQREGFAKDWNDHKVSAGILKLIAWHTRYDMTVTERIDTLCKLLDQLAECSKEIVLNPLSLNSSSTGTL